MTAVSAVSAVPAVPAMPAMPAIVAVPVPAAELELPPSLAREGVEFTLSSTLAVKSSDPLLEPIKADDSTAGAPTRYRLTTAPSDDVLKISYVGTMNFGLSDQKGRSSDARSTEVEAVP